MTYKKVTSIFKGTLKIRSEPDADSRLCGSIQYGEYRLCNDCVLLAETGFALGKIKDIQDLIDAMEDKRLEELCNFIKQDEKSQNN